MLEQMFFEDTQGLLQFFTVVIGCVIFLRLIGKEKYRRETLLNLQPCTEMKPINKSRRPGASSPKDEVVTIAQVVATPDRPPVR